MTVQELRDLLDAYKDEQAEIEDGQRVEVWKVSLGAAQATLSGAAIEALPNLLDLWETIRAYVHNEWRDYDLYPRLFEVLDRLEKT